MVGHNVAFDHSFLEKAFEDMGIENTMHYHKVDTISLAYALLYCIAVPAVCFILALFLMPETRKISIWKPEPEEATARA